MSDFDYGALSDRLIDAQTNFRRYFESLHPYPIKPVQESRRDWLMRGLLVIPMVGAAVVSGDHTISTYAQDKPIIVGIAAFAMLEVMLFVAAFYVTRERFRSGTEKINIVGYMGKGIAVSYVVLLFGNFSDVMTVHGFAEGNLWIGFNLIISSAIALSAPTIALIVGHMQAMLFVQDMVVDRRSQDDYRKQCEEWQQSFDASWTMNKARWGATVNMTVTRETPPALGYSSDVNLVNLRKFTSERPSPKLQKVLTWLEDKPEKWDIGSRELVDEAMAATGSVKLSHTTINKAQRILKGGMDDE